MINKPLKVIYHAECWDGFCAAWIIHKIHPNAKFIPAHYGDPPPDVVGCIVIIADFSYKRNVMLKLIADARGDLIVLDHHETAESELERIVEECYKDNLDMMPIVRFDMGKSGGRLTQEFMRAPDNWIIDYTEDRDLWKHALKYTKEVNAALRSYPLDFDLWDKMSMDSPSDYIDEGAAILRREKQIVDQHVQHAADCRLCSRRWEGYRLPIEANYPESGHVKVVNSTVLISEIAGELAKEGPFGVCYFVNGKDEYVYSLRSTKESGVNVADIAKVFGGGGHKHAAGFTVGSRVHERKG